MPQLVLHLFGTPRLRTRWHTGRNPSAQSDGIVELSGSDRKEPSPRFAGNHVLVGT